MTPEQYLTAIDESCTAAGLGGAEWNRRFVDALGQRGLRLAPEAEAKDHHPEMNLMAPPPYDEDWQYEYPSIIVPKK